MVRITVRFKVKLKSGCPDYNLSTLQSVILKFRTDSISVLERVERLHKFANLNGAFDVITIVLDIKIGHCIESVK